jgi:hypothetical protein
MVRDAKILFRSWKIELRRLDHALLPQTGGCVVECVVVGCLRRQIFVDSRTEGVRSGIRTTADRAAAPGRVSVAICRR